MSMKIVEILVYWTPEEAHTVQELLQALQEDVLHMYGSDIRYMQLMIREV